MALTSKMSGGSSDYEIVERPVTRIYQADLIDLTGNGSPVHGTVVAYEHTGETEWDLRSVPGSPMAEPLIGGTYEHPSGRLGAAIVEVIDNEIRNYVPIHELHNPLYAATLGRRNALVSTDLLDGLMDEIIAEEEESIPMEDPPTIDNRRPSGGGHICYCYPCHECGRSNRKP